MESQKVILRLTDVLEYLYCPRYIYFMHCLDIPQHEEDRLKVLLGREVHEQKETTNTTYLRKKLGVVKKEIGVFLISQEQRIKGILDEILFLSDGTAVPFEYKFAEYKETLFQTYKYQLIMQGMLIQEHYKIPVNKGVICFTRSKHLIKEIPFKEKDYQHAKKIINEIVSIIENGFHPKKTNFKRRCIDCCYRNICV